MHIMFAKYKLDWSELSWTLTSNKNGLGHLTTGLMYFGALNYRIDIVWDTKLQDYQ